MGVDTSPVKVSERIGTPSDGVWVAAEGRGPQGQGTGELKRTRGTGPSLGWGVRPRDKESGIPSKKVRHPR